VYLDHLVDITYRTTGNDTVMKSILGARVVYIALMAFFIIGAVFQADAEVILQFFNNTWEEISEKVPELAQVGYIGLWLPPPQKAGSVYSVGYDLWDPFDLGSKDQSGTVKTRYGTEAELLRLIETAHRHGMRVYFDNIMNHRAFSIPGYDAGTGIDIYPGMLPEDFHLKVTDEGFYRAWENTANWQDTWQVQNQFLSGLIDIAHETPNGNFGANEGDTHPKISFVRHPDNPEYYDFHPSLGHVGFYSTNITTNVIANNTSFFSEDVGGYLMRSIRWLVDRTKLDGLRLDAVKHVPGYFFGEQWDANKDESSSGYNGQAQWQFDKTRGFNDTNYRDTVFDVEATFGRNDLMIFGEHMGEPPPYNDYWASGMRLLDARLHMTLNNNLGNPWGSVADYQYEGGGGFGYNMGVTYAKSHDDNIATRPELHYALELTRRGLPDIYTDGNRQAETLGQSGGAFPRHANTAYLGQDGDNRIPNLVYIHNQFARGWQYAKYGDSDVAAFDRVDKRENSAMPDADGVVMSFMMNDDYSAGAYRDVPTTFANGAYLWQYSTAGSGFYHTVADGTISVTIPPGGYFCFSWRSPEESDLWNWGGGPPLTIYQNGEETGWMSYWRTDGPDGDSTFNPYGVSTNDTRPFGYKWYVPRVTVATNLSFVMRVDGSANNGLLRLDGGIGINSTNHSSGDPRDYPPGNEGSTDVFLGYEQADFVSRIGPEKFADQNTASNKIGSAGSGSYELTIGSPGFTINDGDGANDYSSSYGASFVYHDPTANTDFGENQFWPDPTNAANQDLWIQVKVGHAGDINRVVMYYTTDGSSWPEGAGGSTIGTTHVQEMYWTSNIIEGVTNDWWKCQIAGGFTNNTILRYKIGAYRLQGADGMPWDVVFPSDSTAVERKKKMMGTWQLTNINAETLAYFPANDWGQSSTGLVEGFHFLSGRAFLQRDGAGVGNDKRAAIYNTFKQSFYLDTEVPQGEVVYPAENDTIYDNEYGAVVRADSTVTKVYFHIEDSDDANDDGSTGLTLGNGTNALGEEAWADASEVVPSLNIDSEYMREYRFNYSNIPDGGTNALIYVKLAELSSSTNPTDSAVSGHFGELIRTVKSDGPGYNMFVAWPASNGDTVGEGYVMKVYFSKVMADGVSSNDLRNRFLISIDGTTQPKDDYGIDYNDIDGRYYSMIYELPDLYDGIPGNLHEINVTHTNAGGGGVTLTADRFVLAEKSSTGPSVQITSPPAVDSDGQRFDIVLPDMVSPHASNRQFTITVQTSTNVLETWLVFTNSTADVDPISASTNALSNTVNVTQNSNLVVGLGFESEVATGNQLLISTNYVTVSEVLSDTNIILTQDYPGPTASGLTAYTIVGNPSREGTALFWNYLWTNIDEGTYNFYANTDTDGDTNTIEASAFRTTIVIFREMVDANTNNIDDDDDGITDIWETTPTNLPATNPETWTNGTVHLWKTAGKTGDLRPDSDGDKLPDGLELGYRHPSSGTDTNTDTNGDGYKNFIPDLDPPIYNTVPDNWDLPNYNFNASRTDQILGSVTDPNNPDSDYDGIVDGLEDWNRNGWIDGDGASMPPSYDPWPERDWPDGVWDSSWTETDPNNPDTDGDGASDGTGEDWDGNGWIAGDINSNRIWDAGELWTETNPLDPDIDGDGLPDGWEMQFNLSPWDDGISGHTNMKTGLIISTNENGASGNPDGDYIMEGAVTSEYTNIKEYENGTNPRSHDSIEPPPPGSITVGRGAVLGELTGTGTNYQEFTDWSADDCLVTDQYEGVGGNNEGGDIYKAWDEWDSSRDLIAYYAHDGGAVEDQFYFRVDLHDLKAFAEDGHLDIYIVIDTGNPSVGEMTLPDEVDCVTSMKWEAVVAVYSSGSGQLYVDTDRSHNTTAVGQNLADYGVVGRDQSDPKGFAGAYFNSELDSVEFSVRRQGLTDSSQGAGWNGLDADDLNYQVYTVKDGTCNTCEEGNPGPGDIGGRPDIRDAIYNDYIAEDYWDSQAGLPRVLMYWIAGGTAVNKAHFSATIHGNQAVQPGSTIQNLINSGVGGGYHRPLGVHDLYHFPLNLHITPTLASAIEWAKTDPADTNTWRLSKYADGPLFNDWVAELYQTNVVYLLASTFSDHILPYYTDAYNTNNVALATEYLSDIYGFSPNSNTVFWTPERVLDSDTLTKVKTLGYNYTVVDQMTHLWNWFGRQSSLGSDGYRINKMEDVECFVINDGISDVRFSNYDGGTHMNLRNLLIRKSLDDGTKDQIVSMFSNWSDYNDADDATAYDKNIRWIANHQWIEPVAFEQIATNRSHDGITWWSVDRGSGLSLSKQAYNWLNHATITNYDNWYVGLAGHEEGLEDKLFDIRNGVPLTNAYGMLYTTGIISSTWERVSNIGNSDISRLARSALHASAFETAFHNEEEHDLSRWSTGDYIYPATNNYNTLASFSANAQAQSRQAAMYQRVDQWATNLPASTQTASEDVDLDGEDEYLLYNDRLFAVFERIGGRMIAAWVRDIDTDRFYQAAGNQTGYAGRTTEEEGTVNCDTNGVPEAYRTSCLKDWWAGSGTTNYVNKLYTFSSISDGWRATSSDGAIIKDIVLTNTAWQFDVSYTVGGALAGETLYIRNGLSPYLYNLLRRGQFTLGDPTDSGGVLELANTNYFSIVVASIAYGDAGHTATYNTNAVDDGNGVLFHTINMRNQAQTAQVEIFGSGSFAFALGFKAETNDMAGGMSEEWVRLYNLDSNPLGGAQQDADGDGVINYNEYVANTSPIDVSDYFHILTVAYETTGTVVDIEFPAKPLREYFIDYRNDSLLENTWTQATMSAITVPSAQTYIWQDDGSATAPTPVNTTSRFYKISVSLP